MRDSPTRSASRSTPPSPRPVKRAAVFTHGKARQIGPAVARLARVARDAGVELLYDAEDAARHGIDPVAYEPSETDVALVLGGDGTTLRALHRFLGTGVPVIGVNFGRVGFLTTMTADALEQGVPRVFAGEYTVDELPTLEVELNGRRRVAVNDVVVASATLGRMVEL